MSSLARIVASETGGFPTNGERRDYVPVIVRAMADQRLGQRKLALRTGISKSRLGVLLHGNHTRRATMSMLELETILSALGLNMHGAIIAVDVLRAGRVMKDPSLIDDQRFTTLFAMLSDVFEGLPSRLVEALDAIDGMDGTEVRKEWAGPLKEAIVERLVKEVNSILARRNVLARTGSFEI